jgi:hypothetical protein
MKRYHVRSSASSILEWSHAEAPGRLHLPLGKQRGAENGVPGALGHETHLHFRFDCQDDDLVLPDGPTAKDRVIDSDRVEIFFAPDLSLKPYFCLEMSPRGDVLAYEARFYREMNWDWHCEGLQIDRPDRQQPLHRQRQHPARHTAPAQGALRSREMHAGIYRAEFHHKSDGSVHSGWMPWVNPHTERPDFHVPASFGVLELVD